MRIEIESGYISHDMPMVTIEMFIKIKSRAGERARPVLLSPGRHIVHNIETDLMLQRDYIAFFPMEYTPSCLIAADLTTNSRTFGATGIGKENAYAFVRKRRR